MKIEVHFFVDSRKEAGVRTMYNVVHCFTFSEAHAALYLRTDLGCSWIKVLSR